MSNPPVSPGFVPGQELIAAQLNQILMLKQDYPAVTMPPGTNDTTIATTAFVQAALAGSSGVVSFNSRTGAVTLNSADVTGAGGALSASSVSSFNARVGAVTLTGADITGAGGALAASSVASFNTRTGAVTLTAADVTGVGGALSASSLSLTATNQTFSGGVNAVAYQYATGNITVNFGLGPIQWVNNTGAFTITAPTLAGSTILTIFNGAGAGAVTFSGFTVGANTGDALDTTSGHKFSLMVWGVNGVWSYNVKALQ